MVFRVSYCGNFIATSYNWIPSARPLYRLCCWLLSVISQTVLQLYIYVFLFRFGFGFCYCFCLFSSLHSISVGTRLLREPCPALPMWPNHRAPLYLSAASVRPTVSECVTGERREGGLEQTSVPTCIIEMVAAHILLLLLRLNKLFPRLWSRPQCRKYVLCGLELLPSFRLRQAPTILIEYVRKQLESFNKKEETIKKWNRNEGVYKLYFTWACQTILLGLNDT